jgi:hypothetical protein
MEKINMKIQMQRRKLTLISEIKGSFSTKNIWRNQLYLQELDEFEISKISKSSGCCESKWFSKVFRLERNSKILNWNRRSKKNQLEYRARESHRPRKRLKNGNNFTTQRIEFKVMAGSSERGRWRSVLEYRLCWNHSESCHIDSFRCARSQRFGNVPAICDVLSSRLQFFSAPLYKILFYLINITFKLS